jgi:EmrB/QacA subfamily drug resistance transporter
MTLISSPPSPGVAPGTTSRLATRSPWAVLAVLCASVLVITVDTTIVNVALPTLVRELGASTSQLQWIVDAYVLVFAGLLMAAGSLADRLGRKGTLLVGMVLFAATSAGASLAGSPAVLIAWRAAMGVGAALIFPTTLAILVNVFTDARRRAAAIAVWAATAGLAVALGPVSGGFLLEHFWWGSVFVVNVPLIAVALAAIAWIVPTSRDTTVHRFDPVGVIASVLGVGVLVWSVIEGPKHGWLSVESLVAFGLAAVLLVGFVRWERRIDHPMLDVSVFQDRRFTAGSLSITFAFFALFGFIFMVTQYFQFVRGDGTLAAGVHTVPFALFTATAAPLSALAVRRLGTKVVVALGLGMMAVGFAWTTTDVAGTHFVVIVGQMFFMGFGLGLVNAPATEAILGSLPPEKAGVGSAVNDTARELGGTLGVAIVGSLFASVYAGRLGTLLAGSPLPAEALALARQSAGAGFAVAGVTAERSGAPAGELVRRSVVDAFLRGFHAGSWLAAGVVAAAALAALAFLPARARVGSDAVDGQPAADPSGALAGR